jgi:hypothetical protein
MKKIFLTIVILSVALISFNSCQDLNHPALGDYKKDSNPVGGPLKFYLAFDGTTTNPLMNAVDSIRANFPTDNPLTSIDGVSGKGIQGVKDKFLTFAKPNDWAVTATSFTISFWEKHDGQTKNGANPGAEGIFGIPSTNGHWSGATMFLLFDAAPVATNAAVKLILVDKNMSDTWLTWEGDGAISGLLDNQWHHIALVYDASTSGLTLYRDGTALGTKTWGTHGPINLDDSKITSIRIGNGPQDQNSTGDNWEGSNWKGGLDQFRLYSTALTAAEVNALFTKKM